MGKNISKKNLEKLKQYLKKNEPNIKPDTSEAEKSGFKSQDDKHSSLRGTTRVQR